MIKESNGNTDKKKPESWELESKLPVNEWISVKDRLPKKGLIIVYCSKTHHVSAIGIYWDDHDDPLGPIPSRPNWLTWDTVTHWMPLPELPKD